MLVIDENMLKLAKMQETLLKVSKNNKEENLSKYLKTVSEIDAQLFQYIIEKTKNINEHNQTLEEEVKYLKEIKELFDQLFKLQSDVKNICNTYGDGNVQLSDLSLLNIEYITNRINAIDSYLNNLKNIELNKDRLEKLSEELIKEEKKKLSVDSKLEDLEQALIENFVATEGRTIVDGKLEYTSVATEYSKINFELERLLNDPEYLRSSLSYVRNERNDVFEKVRVAEVCYSSLPNYESKMILDEINSEALKIKYKLTMLEIVEVLMNKFDSYSSFVEKRRSMLDLIRYRLVCMESLGIITSVDPFSRLKVKEQIDLVASLEDNSKTISAILNEISRLNAEIEEMTFQNDGYLITINNEKDIIEDRVSFNDIDITPTVSFDELLIKQKVSDNQVVRVRTASSKLNKSIISQKTSGVLKRVNQMMNGSNTEVVKNVEERIPELLIVPVVTNKLDFEEELKIDSAEVIEPIVEKDEIVPKFTVEEPVLEVVPPITESFIFEEPKLDKEPILVVPSEEPLVVDTSIMTDIFSEPTNLFETVTPFEGPSLFADRAEDYVLEVKKETKPFVEEPPKFEEMEFTQSKSAPIINDTELTETMPDVFWVTQDDKSKSEDDSLNKSLSFDEQIDALLSFEADEDIKVKRKVV